MPRKGKKSFQVNEKQLGYLMVLPAILIILAVIIWPIGQSMYNSLFDYRLNDPERSQTMLSSEVDLERYIDNHFFLEGTLEDVLETAEGEPWQEEAESAIAGISEYHEQLRNEDEVAERYDTVEEMVNSFEVVADQDLKYASIDSDLSESYEEALLNAQDLMNEQAVDADEEDESLFMDASSQIGAVDRALLSSNFIGLSHYTNYFQDSRMWQSLANTFIFTGISVALELFLGLMIALVIHRAFIGRGVVRAAVLIPWAIPTAVSAMMWRYLLDGQSGVIAHYLEQLNLIGDSSTMLSTAIGGMSSVILADVWKTTPYMALLILAGLQTINYGLYEAAEVDGANKLQRFFFITIPMLKSTILVALLFRTLDAFRVFDLIYVLTGGGPANATEVISVYAYTTLFSQQNFGGGSALSVIVFLCIALISIIFIKLIGSDLFEGKTGNS
ncbi:carbohydrate ABC transporter permease [Salisediminibacterium halotolerans]|uniref:Multiple sugar transport system permease protein n=1 Tax=Salisediminibacterium halotolerans TaxID=517425 RepID=A0A1H9R5W2_9BACI|nr:sugar ABC transporter permease [Salisediminibacterium haloalkalitolerans]SER68241.1 multiple sugar transport system permease protein [Salisediminibacterium haloalkalitolerans]